ncbi:unnamed protein product [Phytomonas sp. Hart1]|nr:unnamed protein product [Phytomonas sp. Hart1]|eukprot:CCW66549.1 unnamed protein product [Phytomonas sp. isolate Hart1]
MNRHNTLDAFFPIPRRHPAQVRGSPVFGVYHAFIEWEEALLSEDQEGSKAAEPSGFSDGGDWPHSTCVARLLDKVHSPPCVAAVPLEVILKPIPLNPLLSVYTDLHPLASSLAADSLEEKESNGEKGKKDGPMGASLDPMQLNSENLWKLLSFSPKSGLTDAKLISRHRDARRKLWEEETSARNDLLYQETSAYRLISELASDSMWCILSLHSLQGEFIQDKGLTGLKSRRRHYPLDSLPLANRTTPADTQRLHIVANRTVTLGFLFANKSISEQNPKISFEVKNNKKVRLDDVRKFHSKNQSEAIRRKGEADVGTQSRGFRLFGAPTPPNTCSLPEELPLARSHDPDCVENLPDEVYEEFLERYTEGRHEIISLERKAYRDLMRLIFEVQSKQRRLDELALKRAYAEEIKASDALDLNHYAVYY